MADFVEQVKQTSEYKNQFTTEINQYRQLTLVQQAQLGEITKGQVLAWKQAGQVMANVIYDQQEEIDNLSLENGGLKKQLGTSFNQDELKSYCKEEKLKWGHDDTRNKRILERLHKQLESSGTYLEKSRVAAVAHSPVATDQSVKTSPQQASANKK